MLNDKAIRSRLLRWKLFLRLSLRHYDFWIFLSVLALLSLGLVMMFSASAPSSASAYGDPYYIFRKQLLFALLGVAAMLVLSFVPYRLFSFFAPVILAVAIVLLGAVLLLPSSATSDTGVGSTLSKGATRWLNLGFVSFQPSEVAKFAIICFLSASLAKHHDRLPKFFKGLLPYLLLVGGFVALLLLEPHLSATVIVVAVSAIVLFAAGAKLRHFILLLAPCVAGLYVVVFHIEKFAYIRPRIQAYLDPWQDRTDSGWQIVNSLLAVGSGGLFGRGIGRSMEKYLYIPEPHNDFIFAVVAEELGFIGTAVVLVLFGVFIWRGIKTAMMAADLFGSLLALGITALIGIQSLFNIAVVTAIVPVTGISLPFFSYGGTSLCLFLAEVGILLNISKSAQVDTVLPANEVLAAARGL